MTANVKLCITTNLKTYRKHVEVFHKKLSDDLCELLKSLVMCIMVLNTEKCAIIGDGVLQHAAIIWQLIKKIKNKK